VQRVLGVPVDPQRRHPHPPGPLGRAARAGGPAFHRVRDPEPPALERWDVGGPGGTDPGGGAAVAAGRWGPGVDADLELSGGLTRAPPARVRLGRTAACYPVGAAALSSVE